MIDKRLIVSTISLRFCILVVSDMERLPLSDQFSISESLFRSVLQTHNVAEHSFATSSHEALYAARELAHEFGYTPALFANERRVLELIAVADSLKGNFIQLSEIIPLTHEIYPVFDEEDKSVAKTIQTFLTQEKIERYIERFKDVHLSKEIYDELVDKGDKSLTEEFRKKHNLVSEFPFSVSVLDVSTDEFRMFFNMGGVTIRDAGASTIVIPRDARRSLAVHEWIHTQLKYLRHGTSFSFGAGLNEGLTEHHTPKPETYVKQREIYKLLISELGDDFEDNLVLSALGSRKDTVLVNNQLIQKYRFPGFLALMRMSPNEHSDVNGFYSLHANNVFLPVDNVKDIISYTENDLKIPMISVAD